MESISIPTLMRTYGTLATRLAQRLLGDAEAAADAVQDAFIKAYRAQEQFAGKNLRAWFLRIVTNTCYDQLAQRKRRAALSWEALTEQDSPQFSTLPVATSPTPEQAICQQETWETLLAVIADLPPSHSYVLQRIDIEGYSYAEAAAELGVPMGTVKSRLFRARSQVRDALVPPPGLHTIADFTAEQDRALEQIYQINNAGDINQGAPHRLPDKSD